MKLLRPMQAADVDAVVAIIDSHDEDDAEDAQAGFSAKGGTEDYFVLEHDGQLIGVSGFRTPPACEQTHWLSWTYVHDDYVGQGHGRRMIGEILEHLKSLGGRKVFVKMSDYSEINESGEREETYAAALHLYQALGFTIELTHKDYYDEGEAQIILGMRLRDGDAAFGDADTDSEDATFSDAAFSDAGNAASQQVRPVQFNAVHEIAETDGAFSFGWRDDGKRLFSVEDVELGLQEVKKRHGRAVFLSFPSDYKDIDERLYTAGFRNSGVLDDYFDDGVHEQHFTYTFHQDLLLEHG